MGFLSETLSEVAQFRHLLAYIKIIKSINTLNSFFSCLTVSFGYSLRVDGFPDRKKSDKFVKDPEMGLEKSKKKILEISSNPVLSLFWVPGQD